MQSETDLLGHVAIDDVLKQEQGGNGGAVEKEDEKEVADQLKGFSRGWSESRSGRQSRAGSPGYRVSFRFFDSYQHVGNNNASMFTGNAVASNSSLLTFFSFTNVRNLDISVK